MDYPPDLVLLQSISVNRDAERIFNFLILVAKCHVLGILTHMIWEGRIVSAGEWVECQLSVAPGTGVNFAWVGQLKMRPQEWRDFCSKMNFSEVSAGHWNSDSP